MPGYLGARGYTLALDDFVEGSAAEGLVAYVHDVKLDVLEVATADWQRVARRFAAKSLPVVAERVETVDLCEPSSTR